MNKLVERDAAPGTRPLTAAPALAIQFFLIPMAVVGVVVLIYAGFRYLVTEERSAQDYLNDIRTGGRERRWPAAFELSRIMADPEAQARDPELGRALVQAFAEAKGDDPRVRRYLALAIGRLQSPPPEAVPRLIDAVDDADSETRISAIWALGAMGDSMAVPALRRAYASDDSGIRKVVVYALGALPGDAQLPLLRTALEDPAPDVQWNAALGLARHGQPSAGPVLRRMLDREYVERTVKRTPQPGADAPPVEEVIVSSLRALAALNDTAARDAMVQLSEQDESLRVRQAALEALKRMEPNGPPSD